MVNAIYWKKLIIHKSKIFKIMTWWIENYFHIKYLLSISKYGWKFHFWRCQIQDNFGKLSKSWRTALVNDFTHPFPENQYFQPMFDMTRLLISLLDTQILLVRYDNILIIALVGNEGFLVFARLLPVKQVGDQVDREREDHRRVLLRWYWVQGLQWSMVEFN